MGNIYDKWYFFCRLIKIVWAIWGLIGWEWLRIVPLHSTALIFTVKPKKDLIWFPEPFFDYAGNKKNPALLIYFIQNCRVSCIINVLSWKWWRRIKVVPNTVQTNNTNVEEVFICHCTISFMKYASDGVYSIRILFVGTF